MAFMHSWETNSEYTVNLLRLIERNGLDNYKPVTSADGIYIEFVKRYQLNLVAVSKLIPLVAAMPQMFLPMSTILRTIITDVVIHKYFRKVLQLTDIDGFVLEANIQDLDYIKGMEKAFHALVSINPKDGKAYQDHFYEWFKVYFDDNRSRLKSAHFRKNFPDVETKLVAFKKVENRDTEWGKLQFLDDKNIDRIKFLYLYLNQLHHYSTRSKHFFEPVPNGDDYRQHNIDYTFAIVYFAVECTLHTFTHITPDNPIIPYLESLKKEMWTLDNDTK